MTIAELLARGAHSLTTREGLSSPVREARFLLARLLDRPESWLLAHPEEPVDEATIERFDDWVAHRAGGKPVHYIIDTCPFWGREFVVTPEVLIPRPDTEFIVEHALTLVLPSHPRILDVGTGCGNLGVTLALEMVGAQVIATDLSTGATAVARRNATRLGARVRFATADLASPIRGRFDLVVANLPYVPDQEIATLAPEIRDFEPRVALVGGADGADLLRAFVVDLPRLLAPGGTAMLELGRGQIPLLQHEIESVGLVEAGRLRDAGNVERVLVLRNAG